MSAVLEFALGLKTSEFLSNLGISAEKVLSFEGVMEGLKFMAEGTWKAIEQGASLEALHKRTGESVADLFKLQNGFEAAGLDSGALGDSVMHLQRALGGINEMGERTPDIFRLMGLNIRSLRQENATQQFLDITAALGKLGPASAAAASAGIFGRGAYSNIIQLSNSTHEFAEGMAGPIKDARIWERDSAAF